MEYITEDPIPFPPDPIDDGAPTHSKTTPSNTPFHTRNDEIKRRSFSQKYLSTTSADRDRSETDSTPNATRSLLTKETSTKQTLINQMDVSSNETASLCICPSASNLATQDTNHTSFCDEDEITEKHLTVRHLVSADDASLHREYRVKLYQLSDDGNWKDEGTGVIQFELRRDEMNVKRIEIRIFSEEDRHKILLQHTALSPILYDKQGDSIIQWLDGTDVKTQIERAISFQHKAKCLEVWRLIAFMKGYKKLSHFEAETRKHKNNEDEDIRDGKYKVSNSPSVEFESDPNGNNNNDDDDDVEMNELSNRKNEIAETDTDRSKERTAINSDSNGLLTTFLNDHREEQQDTDNDNDIDINIEENKQQNHKIKLKNKKKKKRKKKKKKKETESNQMKEDKSESDDSDYSENDDRSNTVNSSDDEETVADDGGTQFLQKLTMRTQNKAYKKKLEIPMPTTHNLCEVYVKIKNAMENKDISVLNQLGSIQWRDALYSVFLSIERDEEHKCIKQQQQQQPPPQSSSIPNLEKMNDDDASYHPLELIFKIVLECCRECQQIKQKQTKKSANDCNPKSEFRIKIESIRQQQLGYIMHSSFAQLLSTGTFGHAQDRNDNCTLMMVYLGKEFIAKSIAMLEYDPIRRGNQENITLSYKHRSFLNNATPKRLNGIEMIHGDELYDEIEYVYKLNYVRDCVLLGKLDLEQQAFHILNHHIARYNAVICETIAEDTTFVHNLFDKIKQSCSKHYGIIPLDNEDNKLSGNGHVSVNEIEDEGDDDINDNDHGGEYYKAISRRKHNRKELFNAPDGVLFRFLSEFLCRIKCINDPQTRSAIFIELIQNGLLHTLNICVSAFHVLPTKEFSHIWLVLVECIHHMISCTPCANAPQVRAYIVKQIEDFNKIKNSVQYKPKSATLLQRLCSTFSSEYICSDEGILDQIYYVIVSLLGLDDLMGLDGAQTLSFIGLGDRDLRTKRLKVISSHFFAECVPLFYRILSASNRYISCINTAANYQQIKTIQKHVINLLSACCEQEQFIPKLKELEEKYDLMSSIHNLIYVPKDFVSSNKTKTIPNKDLSMCCIRFLRECLNLAQHDKFWSTRIKNYGLFKNVLCIFDCNGLDKYNMINSTVLSIFASIEDKKLEDIILYLGDEKILEKYSKLIDYTTKFDDLIELYEKTKQGIPIQSQIDEQSTVSLSNCSSLSPRISPSGLSPGIIAGNGGWNNQPSKEEIHYFDDSKKTEEEEQEEEEQAFMISKYKTGHPVYKDSPRPNASFHNKMRKELKLPNRTKNNNQDSFDLLSNANAIREKQQHKKFSLSIGRKQNIEKEKEASPFLITVSNAMEDEPTKGTKRKYADICDKETEENVNHNYISNNFEVGHYLSNTRDEAPPKKKIKLMNGNHLNKHNQINESPDTFEMDKNSNCIAINGKCNDSNCKKPVMNPAKSILLNSKIHQKHNKHVHFETDDQTKDVANHSNQHSIDNECLLHSEIIKNAVCSTAAT